MMLQRYRWGWVVLVLMWCVASVSPQQTTCSAGRTERMTYNSSLLGQQMYYTVYTPPCYDTSAQDTYPVLYLMHGSNEDDGHWARLGLVDALDTAITDGVLPPTVVVMPFGNVIANRNRFDQVSWANIFMTELVPDVEARYAISTARAQRAIGGISRGGFWAYHIALRYPQQFTAVGGHSAFFDLFHAPDDHNPLMLTLDPPADLQMWLDRGQNDFAANGLDLMSDRLATADYPHTYRIYAQGEHNNAYWRRHLPDYLAFYGSALRGAPADDLLYPVVGFPSIRTTITRERLNNVAQGAYDADLVLTQAVADALATRGIALHPQTRITTDDPQPLLWRDRDTYSLLPINQLSPQYRVLWVDDVPVLDQLASYPFAPTASSTRPLRITLSGVTALTRNTRLALVDNGVLWAASGIQSYVTRSDIFHMSNEVSVVDTCPQTIGTLLGGSNSFCMMPDHLNLFALLDVDVIDLSGNHNNDYGYQAYRDTLRYYQANGFATVGGGETVASARAPHIIEQDGQTVAWVSCNAVGPYYALVNEDEQLLGGVRPGAAGCDWEWLNTTLPDLAAQYDVLIVTVQHQEREEYTPTRQQQVDFRRMADLGADVVMGTAAHKPQTYEFYATRRGDTALIHYGMGNLFFDQPFWGNRRFFMNTLYIHDGAVRTLEIYPGIIDDLARPRLMTADERLNFLQFMFIQQNGF